MTVAREAKEYIFIYIFFLQRRLIDAKLESNQQGGRAGFYLLFYSSKSI